MRIDVLGSHYSAYPREEIAKQILAFAKEQKPGYVCVGNVHTTMTGYFDDSYRQITNGSTFSVPDGMPIVWAMKALGAPAQDRVRGPSMMRELCDRGRLLQVKHYLMGGSEKTLKALKDYLETNYPRIQIVGMESPPFRMATPEEDRKRVDRINASGAQILWVGLGAPKQEIWMWEHRQSVKPFMMGIGAAFDLLAGMIPEAPLWMQALGMEWIFRFAHEPRRLWRRYLFNNPAFVILLTRQWIWSKFSKKNAQ